MEISVLFVDDEYYICKNICSRIKKLNIESVTEVRACYSGEEAIEICKHYKPQIVITDMKMEEMSGIELIQKLKQSLFPVRFIVLSGYDDYQFVRTAFQEGASDYLLKPILTEQLDKVLRQQCSQLENKEGQTSESRAYRVQTAEKLFLSLEKRGDSENEVLSRELASYQEQQFCFFLVGLEQKISTNLIHSIINSVYDLEDEAPSLTCWCSAASNQKLLVLLSQSSIKANNLIVIGEGLIQKVKKITGTLPAVSISHIGTLKDIPNLFEDSENYLCRRIVEGYGQLFFDAGNPELIDIPINLKKSTEVLVNNIEVVSHTEIWETIVQELSKLPAVVLKNYYYYLIGLLYSVISLNELNKNEFIFPTFYQFGTFAEFIQTIKLNLDMSASFINQTNQSNNILDEVREYIDENFGEKLKLSEIASYYYVSYSYLSKLFHETYGVSFQEYLTSKRMEYAKNLLQTQQLSLQEIADSVGYNNVFNFSRAFKKYFGEAPNHYRKKK